MSKIVAEIRPLLGADENQMVKKNKGSKALDNLITNQMRQFVISFNEHSDRSVVNHVIDNMTAMDSKHLRNVFKAISPDLQTAAGLSLSYIIFLLVLENGGLKEQLKNMRKKKKKWINLKDNICSAQSRAFFLYNYLDR